MEQLAKARAGLPPPSMPPARLPLRQQAGLLQRLLHVAIGQRHAMFAAHDLMKVLAIEPAIAVAVQPQHPLELDARHAMFRRTAPLVDQPVIAPALIPLTPPS